MKYNIYFAASIRGGRDNESIYSELVNYLNNEYGVVLNDFFASKELTDEDDELSDEFLYERDMKRIENSDACVAEVTTPSLGVGYEIRELERLNKPVLCLYQPQEGKKFSAILGGDPNTRLVYYKSKKEAFKAIDEFFNKCLPKPTSC